MRAFLILAATAIVVTGCARVADSRFNPLNWFGRPEQIATTPDRDALRPLVLPGDTTTVVDGRSMITQVTDLQVDRTPTGAIITARGVAPSAGYFNAQLVHTGTQSGVMTFEFRAEAPATPPAGSGNALYITAATSVDLAGLQGVSAVVVVAQSGSLRVSR